MSDTDPENARDETIDIISEEEEQNSSVLIQKLRGKLKLCEAERHEYLTGWQRAKADLVNARKDEERERATFVRFAAERLVRDLLPVLESFEMAFSNPGWEQAPLEWRQGIEHIHAQLVAVLERSGLGQVRPEIGEKFDPTQHESAGETPVESAEQDHEIVSVVRRGYRLYDKLIQPARVMVGISGDTHEH
ncbi:MAG: nucleotide exchange factor GrpE [bacterium]|nr:nucleotide exchange factor GrpE [bacterium]MDZ4284437.1 nucleotide exchange factor GrpE [Patescibacteria group bacterium]